MSFFQNCICHALMGSRLAPTPPFGGSNPCRMAGWEGINNLFIIPDQRVSQNIPWKLNLTLWIIESVFPGFAFPRVGLPGVARLAVGEAGRVEPRGVLRLSRIRGGHHGALLRAVR